MLGMQFQIAEDGAVDAHCPGILPPDPQVRLDIHPAHTVQGDQVKIPHRLIILRRVACRHDHPSSRDSLVAKGLALQKLQHRGGQGLGHAVDLVNEQDALGQAGGLHLGIDAGNDLAHGVLGHRYIPPCIVALPDKGQAHGALTGMVGDGVGHQRHAAIPGGLLHDLGLAHTRRAHQQDGTLAHSGDLILSQLVLGKVGPDGALDLFFCSFDIHTRNLTYCSYHGRGPAPPPVRRPGRFGRPGQGK